MRPSVPWTMLVTTRQIRPNVWRPKRPDVPPILVVDPDARNTLIEEVVEDVDKPTKEMRGQDGLMTPGPELILQLWKSLRGRHLIVDDESAKKVQIIRNENYVGARLGERISVQQSTPLRHGLNRGGNQLPPGMT